MALAGEPAAVDDEDVAGDVVAGCGGEEDGGAGEVFGVAPAAGGDALEDLTIAGLVGLESFSVGGGEVAGRDGVDLDVAARPLVGEGFGELGNSAFAGGVCGNADAALEAEERGNVDDFAWCVAGDHVAADELAELEDRGEVDLQDLLPGVERVVLGLVAEDHAGVVYQDVDAAEFGDDFGEEARCGVGGGQVCLESCGVAADGCRGFSGGAAIAMTRDGCAGLGEASGDSGTESGGCSRDESDFAVEAKEAGHVLHEFQCSSEWSVKSMRRGVWKRGLADTLCAWSRCGVGASLQLGRRLAV